MKQSKDGEPIYATRRVMIMILLSRPLLHGNEKNARGSIGIFSLPAGCTRVLLWRSLF